MDGWIEEGLYNTVSGDTGLSITLYKYIY